MADVKIIPAKERSANIIRTAAYARVSSSSDDQLNSLSAQIRYYTEMLQNSTDTVFVDMYADEGITGTSTAKREDFNRLMCDCRKGKIDRILTKSISRFARNTKDCLEAVRELKELGISVYFEKENLDTGEIQTEMLLAVYSQFAQEESLSISKNCRMGVHKKMQDGTYIGASSPYGYKLEDGNLVIEPETAERVKQIFAWYSQGYGTQEILEKIYLEYGERWQRNKVTYILRNERYVGDRLLQKHFTTDTLPFHYVRNKGEKEQYYVSNVHQPIIDRETFENVQQRLNTMPQSIGKLKQDYPLHKKIKCCCGETFKRKARGNSVHWVCRNHDYFADSCKMKQIPETEFYTAFIRMFNKLIAGHKAIFPPLIRQLQELADRKISGNAQIVNIRKQIAQVKEQAHLTAQLNAQGILDSAYYTAKCKEHDSKLIGLQKQLHALSDNDKEDEQIGTLKRLSSLLEAAEPMKEFNSAIFEQIVERIMVISESEIKIRLIGGIELPETIQRKGRR